MILRPPSFEVAVASPLYPVQPGRIEQAWRQKTVDLRDRPSTDDGERTAEAPPQRLEILDQPRLHFHCIGRGRDVDEGAVEVEKESAIHRGDPGGVRAPRRARQPMAEVAHRPLRATGSVVEQVIHSIHSLSPAEDTSW